MEISKWATERQEWFQHARPGDKQNARKFADAKGFASQKRHRNCPNDDFGHEQ
jgi:hypothetical protein